MKPYLLSLGIGILVGVTYGVLNVKSPAPPVVALVGLLGMLGGEQAGKRLGEWRALASLAGDDARIPVQAPAKKPNDVIGG